MKPGNKGNFKFKTVIVFVITEHSMNCAHRHALVFIITEHSMNCAHRHALVFGIVMSQSSPSDRVECMATA